MAKPRVDDPMFVRLEPGAASLIEASAKYHTATSDLCRTLQCSRGFVTDHVHPQVHRIYVDGRYAKHVWSLGTAAGRGGNIYLDADLDAIARASAVERRVRLVWPGTMMAGHERAFELYLEDFSQAIYDAQERDHLSGDPLSDSEGEVREEYRALLADMISDASPEWAAVLEACREENYARRGATPWCSVGDPAPCSWAALAARGWQTAAAMTDWGETSEMVHRRIWRSAMLRITVPFGDGTQRILYAPDPTPEHATCALEASLLEPYAVPVHALPVSYDFAIR